MSLIKLYPAELALCSKAASFLQSDFWGSFKSRFGWTSFAFNAEWNGTDSTASHSTSLLVLYRRLIPGFGLAYIPWGPELPAELLIKRDNNKEFCQNAVLEIAAALRSLLPKDTALIRFDFPWYTSAQQYTNTSELPWTFKKPLSKAVVDVQAPDTVLIDLAPEEKTILGNMKSKWRYNIGLAEKKGVSVQLRWTVCHADSESSLDAFYSIYKETAARDRINIHGKAYYMALFEEAAKYNIDLRLYLASHEGEDIAGIIVLLRGKEAIYLYGASSNHKRNLMAPYALQWKAMQDAKAAGCLVYDLFGIPPGPPEVYPDHPMAGLYRFKTGFAGDTAENQIIRRFGCWDYPLRPLASAAYSAAEKIRKKIRDRKKRGRL